MVDPEKWDPCECAGGGIHFCRPDQVGHWYRVLPDLTWIREVTVPDDAQFAEFEEYAKADRVFLGPRMSFKEYVAAWSQDQCWDALMHEIDLLRLMTAEQRTEEFINELRHYAWVEDLLA